MLHIFLISFYLKKIFLKIFFQVFYLFSCLFIYFWLIWVFIAVHGLSLVAASGGYSSLRCTAFSLRWLLLLRSTGSKCVGFSSCRARAQLLRDMWDLPGPGVEPVSPALEGRFLTTVPPGKSLKIFLMWTTFKVFIEFATVLLLFYALVFWS